MAKDLKVGDKVAYSGQFLRNIGQGHGPMAQARGIVTDFVPLGDKRLVCINWIGGDMPIRVLEANLARIGLNTEFSAC